ncbi:MAG: hydroxyglutarate oxidase [Chitinophagales bacterium]|nr:MAG: hydroxyglutarate oxidase [Chitinophagales bacterium]
MYDVIIVGAGIVGLATAFRLSERNPDVRLVILEKESAPACHQTGHNSGVIHSGIYYKPGSLKALNCVKGYHQLLAFCRLYNIPFDICGKVIVATQRDQLPLLERILERGLQNGLNGVRKISSAEIQEKEPYVTRAVAGIWVPQAGIINYRQVALQLAELIAQKGGRLQYGAHVLHIRQDSSEIIAQTTAGDFRSRLLINCAGLYSDTIARFTVPQLDMRIIPFRGEYYRLKKEKEYLVRNLIYPVPDPNFPFLGVHFTRMIQGGIEAGPNAVLAFRKEGYRLSDFQLREFAEILAWPGFRKLALKYWKTELKELHRSFSKAAFVKALKNLVPSIEEHDLEPGGAGVRAQAVDRWGNLVDDFLILEGNRVLNVCNAPSPAATSSLAIGEHIADVALPKLHQLGANPA